jgi:proteasome lid subunit RPN8/RPN11
VTTLLLPDSIRDEIVAHASEGAPEEVCGVLAGARGTEKRQVEENSVEENSSEEPSAEENSSEVRRVEAHHPAENVAETPQTRYEIDPREQLELLEAVEAAGREVVGFYHSHPRGPAQPSATDAAQATWPDRSYVIVALDGGDEASVGSWRWTGEAFEGEVVRVVEDS